MSWPLIVNGETALMSIYLEKHWKTSRYERTCELSSMQETFSIRVCMIERTAVDYNRSTLNSLYLMKGSHGFVPVKRNINKQEIKACALFIRLMPFYNISK